MHKEVPFHVAYLTGPPSSGKSTIAKLLEDSVQPLQVISYSELLRQYIEGQYANDVTIEKLRRESSNLITPEVVKAVDKILIDRINKQRHTTHILVDSHPVTKEGYGFRVTAFSISLLQELAPTMIYMLYAKSSVIKARLERDSQGRQRESTFEIDFHRSLQANVAIIYGITLGVPVYLLDSSKGPQDVAMEIAKRLEAQNLKSLSDATSS